MKCNYHQLLILIKVRDVYIVAQKEMININFLYDMPSNLILIQSYIPDIYKNVSLHFILTFNNEI